MRYIKLCNEGTGFSVARCGSRSSPRIVCAFSLSWGRYLRFDSLSPQFTYYNARAKPVKKYHEHNPLEMIRPARGHFTLRLQLEHASVKCGSE